MVQRQLPNPRDRLELMHFKKPNFNGKKRRLESALTIADLRAIAKRRTAPSPSSATKSSAP